MPTEHKTVFISYRRSVASFIARAIFLDLRAHRYDVFMDVESIDSGQFEQIIFNQVEARAHFLVILTPGTADRFANPDDMMRREIEYAIDKQRNIVPLLINNFSFTDAQPYLTGKLAQLPGFNGLNVPHDYFDEAMKRLRTRFLKLPVTGVVKPAPAAEQPAVQQKIETIAAQPAPTVEQLSAEGYHTRGLQKRRSGDYAGAIADYNEAIRLNPQYDKVFNHRGVARRRNNDLTGAIADYDEALRLNPNYARAYNNRGEAHFALGNFDGALADFRRALTLEVTGNRTAGLAITHFALGQKAEAKRLWHTLLAQDQRYSDADWVGKELGWYPTLIEAARKLIAEL